MLHQQTESNTSNPTMDAENFNSAQGVGNYALPVKQGK
jgi:hypothetical protein